MLYSSDLIYCSIRFIGTEVLYLLRIHSILKPLLKNILLKYSYCPAGEKEKGNYSAYIKQN
jgi:hypothetical protein